MLEVAGLVIGRIFGAIAGSSLLSALTTGVIVWFLAYNLGVHDGTRDMVTAIEKAELEAEILNLKNEKKIAEDAAKQAEADEASAADLASKLAGELNDYKDKLAKAGRSCKLTPDDICDIYGVPRGCRGKRKKAGDRPPGLGQGLLADLSAAHERRCLGRPQAMRECGGSERQ